MCKSKDQQYNSKEFKSIRELQLTVSQIADLIYAKYGHDRLRLFDDILALFLAKFYDESYNISNPRFNQISQMSPDRAITEFTNLLKTALESFDLSDLNFFLEVDSKLLLSCIGILKPFSLKKTMLHGNQTDILGTFYQQVVSSTFRGSLGAYLTPKPVCDLAVKICKPKEDDTIFDTSCGTGTFLLSAHRFRTPQSNRVKQVKKFDLFGIDIQERMVLTTIINSIFHGDVIPHIFRGDGLTTDLAKLKKKDPNVPSEGFSLIVGNPPFAGYEDNFKVDGTLSTKSSQRGAGTRVHKIIPFVFKVLTLLRPGGRAALVIPMSVLNAESNQFKWLRDVLKEKAHITAIIGLPRDAFIHTDCGVEGALLFFEKKRIDPKSTTFVTNVNNLGYGRNGRLVKGSETEKIVRLWKEKSNSMHFSTERLYKEERWDPKWIRFKLAHKTVFSGKKYFKLTDVASVVNRHISLKKINPDQSYSYFELRDADINTGIVKTIHSIEGKNLGRKGRLRLQVKKGDILLPNHRDSLMAKTSRGIGRSVIIVDDGLDGYLVSNRFIALRPRVDPLVLSALLNSRFVREQLVMHSRGSASFDIRDKVLNDIWIPKALLTPDNVSKIKEMMRTRIELINGIHKVENQLDLFINNSQ